MPNKHLKKINRNSNSNYDFDRSKYLRLDRNERTIPFSKKILRDLKKNISNTTIQSYPMGTDNLKILISKKEKINKNFINIVPGSDSAIKYIFEIFSLQKNRFVATIYPTYGMIEVYAKIYKNKLLKVNFPNNKFNLNNFFKRKTKFIYIANPNQPSGVYINKKNILKIIEKAKKNNTYVVIDEAYIDFSEFESLSIMIKKFKNLIILKSLSKSFGMAGVRIGYILANPEINKILNTVRANHDVSFFSIKAAEYFMKNLKISKNFINEIKDSKSFIIKECIKRRLKFKNTQTNFFYIMIPSNKIKKIHNFLFKNRILVRSNYLGSFKNFNNSIRITVGSKKEMSIFFKYFDKIYRKAKVL